MVDWIWKLWVWVEKFSKTQGENQIGWLELKTLEPIYTAKCTVPSVDLKI